MIARSVTPGGGVSEREAQEAINAYYVDLASDEEEGAAIEAQVDDMLNDLELLFQEKLATLAEDVAEHHWNCKGKVVIMEEVPAACQGQQDHPSIMVLEESKPASTKLEELISQQSVGGSRWYIQPKPYHR